MKKIISLLFVMAMVLTACEGDQGPPGPPGADGGIIEASAFEIEVDFDSANKYEHTEKYGFEVRTSDVTLVYILWETLEGTDVWRLLPQNVVFDNGELIYNFDFTQTDVRFFLDGDVDFSTIGTEWTQKQVFRVVVVPAENVDSIDVTNFDSVLQATNIQKFELK